MDNATKTFSRLRPRLLSIAYRMLGSLAEAEEVVQDVWLRWHEADRGSIDSPEAWLVSVVTRMSIDRLRTAKVERESYPGLWLPEPLLTEPPATPEETLEQADQISLALLLILERLGPEARGAFLLHEVFDAKYAEIAHMIGKSEAACRQLVLRARRQLQARRPRRVVTADVHRRLVSSFAKAMTHGDLSALRSMLAEDAEMASDGGGKELSFPRPLIGAARIAQLFYATQRRYGRRLRIDLVGLNGQQGLLRFVGGRLESA
jgi:RNA polymerase sigma-70 factor (TIGR02957 family)